MGQCETLGFEGYGELARGADFLMAAQPRGTGHRKPGQSADGIEN